MYADMQPSKAAPILESLTMDELVQILSAMKNDERIGILEKMNPDIAAAATMKLKDAKTSDNLAIAALQSELKKKQTSSNSVKPTQALDQAQLSQTFAGMAPENAAAILLQTYKMNSEKALVILSSMDDATRGKVLEEISKNDAATAAQLVNKLMGTK
nr:hypothetical protein [Paenibacillus sediminis]